MNSTNEDESHYDILTTTLPWRPGMDTFSKALLREESIKNIVISATIGHGISGDAYTLGFNKQTDGRRVDCMYMPLKQFKDLPPVIVEIQRKVDLAFMGRAIRYCLNTLEITKRFPVLVVIGIDGISSRQYRDEVFNLGVLYSIWYGHFFENLSIRAIGEAVDQPKSTVGYHIKKFKEVIPWEIIQAENPETYNYLLRL